MKKIGKFRKGAASFYVVAISTLILVIVAASFAAVIISEVTRTSNDDLAQSAYDSALAGVEDAKLAYYNYQSCLEGSASDEGGMTCDEVIALIEESDSCDMVAKVLGRIGKDDEGEVLIEERIEGASNNMQQAYTCVKLTDILPDYRTTLTSSNPTKVMRAKFDGVAASSIKSIRVSWQGDRDTSQTAYSDFTKSGIFSTDAPLPPVISVGLIQTTDPFNLSDFDMTTNGKTDRGTVYLVPTNQDLEAADNYKVASGKYIGQSGFLDSNDKTAKNVPYAVKCVDNSDFACSVTIALPEPVGEGGRSDKTFMIALSMPYARSNTDVKLEFCSDANWCSEADTVNVDGETQEKPDTRVSLKSVQIGIDSTGRANDLYRRVETRLEPADTTYPYPLYAIQLLGNDSGSLIKKSLSPTCEWDFEATGPRGVCEDTE